MSLVLVMKGGSKGRPGIRWRDDVNNGNWLVDTLYHQNDGVYLDGTSYRAAARHTSSAVTEPGVGADWQTVWRVFAQGANADEVNTVAANIDEILAVYEQLDAVGIAAANIVPIKNVADSIVAVATVAGISGAVTTVAANVEAIGVVASSIANVGVVADNIANVNEVADNIGGISDVLNAKVEWRGAYSGGTAYVARDAVRYEGSGWIAKTDTTGNAPPSLPTEENAWWELYVEKGEAGAPGDEQSVFIFNSNGDDIPEGQFIVSEYMRSTGVYDHVFAKVRIGAGQFTFAVLLNGSGVYGPVTVEDGSPLDDDEAAIAVQRGDVLTFVFTGVVDVSAAWAQIDGVAS